MGEVEWWAFVKSLAAGSEATTLGHGEIQHDLDIASPISGVGKDEDGVDDNVLKVAGAGVGVLLISQLAEGSGSGVVLDDIARGDDILESVTLSDEAAFLALTTDNKNGAVLLGHLAHGSVATDELARLDIVIELLREVAAALLLGLATTVGEEDVWDLDAVFVVAIQDLHGLDGFRDGLSAADEDAIDIKGKDERVCD